VLFLRSFYGARQKTPSTLSRLPTYQSLCEAFRKFLYISKMVAAADSLVWELVKNNNSFMRKKSGKTSRSGSVRFSVERGNLASLSTYKYSGIANSKTIDISSTDDNRAALTLKTKKAGTSGKSGKATIALNKSFRRTAKTITGQAADNYYRSDLKSAALAKYSAVYRGNRAAKGVKKARAVKRGRA
ncbi:60S ribosomal protein L28, partial [Skeletonema marinoi]